MTRQQRRAAERRSKKEKTKTYNLNQAQIQERVQKAIDLELKEHHEEILDETINASMVLLLSLPLKVLMDHYWTKSYEKRIPEFTNYLLEYYKKWQDGELDMEELQNELWEYGHVRLKEV